MTLDASDEHCLLATKICIEVAFRDFGAPGDVERAGFGITVFSERLERGSQDALLHLISVIGDSGPSLALSYDGTHGYLISGTDGYPEFARSSP